VPAHVLERVAFDLLRSTIEGHDPTHGIEHGDGVVANPLDDES